MRKTIILNGDIQVIHSLCTVSFNIRVMYQRLNACVSKHDLSNNAVGVTHAELYEMIERAHGVKEGTEKECLTHGRIAELDMGSGIFIDVWKITAN